MIVNGQQDGSAFVVALDCETGEARWTYKPANDLRSFSTPVLTTVNGQTQIIIAGANQTVGLNAASGELVWSASGPNQKFVSTPSIVGDLVLSFAGSPTEKAMAVRLGGQGDVTDTHIIWRLDRAMPYVPSPVVAGGYAHVINDAGIYTCIEPTSGRVLKTVRRGGNTYSSPVAAAGRVYLFEDSGRCTVIAEDANYQFWQSMNWVSELSVLRPYRTTGSLFAQRNIYGASVSRGARVTSLARQTNVSII